MKKPATPEKTCPNCSLLHTRWGETCRERLRAEVTRLQAELRARSSEGSGEKEVRYLRERLATETAGLRAEIDRLMDPIVRAKMLQPPPPIVIPSSEGRDAALRAEIAEWRRIAAAIPEDSHDERTAIFRCASRVEVLLRTEAEDWPESAHRTARVFLERDATTYDAHGCPACDHPVERTLTCANCDEEIPVIVEPPPDASPSPADRERAARIDKPGRYVLTSDFVTRGTISVGTLRAGTEIEITQVDAEGGKVIGPQLADWTGWDRIPCRPAVSPSSPSAPRGEARDAPSYFDKRAADTLAWEVQRLIDRKVIDSRSPAADALLDYVDPGPNENVVDKRAASRAPSGTPEVKP